VKPQGRPVRKVVQDRPGYVCVLIGPRREVLERDLAEAREVVRSLHKQPSPVIWRALGIA
jgi:hypothetical protein